MEKLKDELTTSIKELMDLDLIEYDKDEKEIKLRKHLWEKDEETLFNDSLHDEIQSIVYDKEADFFLSIEKLYRESKDMTENRLECWDLHGFFSWIQSIYSDHALNIEKKYQEKLLNHLKKINKELLKSLWQAFFKRVDKMTELNLLKEAHFNKGRAIDIIVLKSWRDLCWQIQDAIDKIRDIEGSEEFIEKYVKFIDENREILYRNIGILLKINKIKTEKTLKTYLKENHDKDVISEEKVFNKKLLWLIYKKGFIINRLSWGKDIDYVDINIDKKHYDLLCGVL